MGSIENGGGATLIEWGSIDPHFFSKIYVIYFDFAYNLDKIDMDIRI
jgi:hypothetical protein